LFHEDITIRDRARKTFCKQINNVITASYGAELCFTHNCLNENIDVVHKQEAVQNIFQEQDPSTFRRARHKELCTEIQGGLMSCSDCGKIISTSDIMNSCLQWWRDIIIPSNRLKDNRPDAIIPLSKERLDMEAYTFTYHMENGCALEKDCFGGNKHVRELLLKYRFEDQLVTRHLASRKDVNVDSFSHLCQLPVHTFMRIKVFKMKMKYCGIH
jgi:hypothetical protein